MDVVAVLALARSVEEEAPLLAAELGLTAYEVGLMLRAPLPVVVLRTEDRARALDVLKKLRSRGHDATACSLDDVAASETMFRPRSFRFDGDTLVGLGPDERHFPLASAAAFVRATHRTQVEDAVTTRERKLSIDRAVLTGGLRFSKMTETQTKRVTDEREFVLYVFRRDGPPWLLVASQLRYDGLGEAMRRSRHENFDVLVAALRELASTTPYDDRLLAARPAPTRVVTEKTNHSAATSAGAVDLLAHLVAISLGRAARPYR